MLNQLKMIISFIIVSVIYAIVFVHVKTKKAYNAKKRDDLLIISILFLCAVAFILLLNIIL